ncbi:hypothetical protein BO86DRAFT_388962 [Aspergillus japonicus CBS 114.51]|uniref:Uncharacterized protein n=1 Tax=Aspergillus japonicus CBS 114.51 TaxID=1448312 RepID=A0A8T8X411_ASPJA|nr:hypothetical protein BO86DRAFT_388962 [Aspergillus japonicus CBS 114.51]RAH82249.1 hypothetical protein BO86DRAFT_388962 [Aspergillus japonicus CBS 114.51]
MDDNLALYKTILFFIWLAGAERNKFRTRRGEVYISSFAFAYEKGPPASQGYGVKMV